MSTALRAGKISFTVWAVRKCRPRKASTLLQHMLKGIVKFNQIGKPVHAVSVGHGLADFPQHVADSGSGNTKASFIASRRLYQHARCRHQVSISAGTLFHAARIFLVKWFWAIYLMPPRILYQTECWHSHSKTSYLKYQSDLSCKYTCIREKRSIKITDNTVNI